MVHLAKVAAPGVILTEVYATTTYVLTWADNIGSSILPGGGGESSSEDLDRYVQD